MTEPDPDPPPDIEANKTVRHARAQGCTCVWHWVDNGQEDGGTEPAIQTVTPGCPLHDV